jgi:hypothetical protein
MARLSIVGILIAIGVSIGVVAQAANNGAKVGNGGFLLNVIAFEHCPSGDFLDSNRHEIAVQASFSGAGTNKDIKKNKILLKAGDDFWVQDGNACDNDGANFYLPITSTNCGGGCEIADPTFTQYEVRARLVGKPNGSVTVTSCVEESTDDLIIDNGTVDTLCSVGSNVWVESRTVGNGKEQNRFENVSAELLTVCVDTNPDDGVDQCDDRIGLFDTAGQDYWWNWGTNGRPHVQLVFDPVQSGVQ